MSARRWTAVLALAVAAMPAAASAQSAGGLAERVRGAEDGTVRFSVAARPGVEICDQGIRMGDHHMQWRTRGRGEMARNCRNGPIEVEVEVRGGQVRDIDVPTRDSERSRGAVDLGQVGAAEAVDWLADVVRGSESDRAARDAVFPMILADVPEIWRELIVIARDRGLLEGARKNALFWLGQEAADAATDGLADVARDEDEDQEIRDAAVFALSQRPKEEGVPILMQVARSAQDAKTRRSAMFWLAQTDDPRVLAFFEEILVGPGGR